MTPTNQGLQILKKLAICVFDDVGVHCMPNFFLKKTAIKPCTHGFASLQKIWVMLRIQKPHNVLCEHSGDNNIQH